MSAICTDLVELIAERQFASAALLSAFGLNSVGIFSSSMNQLGLGLMLSTVLIIVPPMAGNWFNGVMGGYFAANYMDRWNNPNGQNTVGTGQGSGAHGIPAYGNQQQSVNYQTTTGGQNLMPNPSSPASIQNVTRNIATNASQTSNPTTPAGLAVGVGKQAQQSNPNSNNGGSNNGSA